MADIFDVVVIGSGPGGYSAAIRCAQKGMTVACIEKGPVGGTCLNVGCIPSKTLLGSAHTLLLAKHADAMGIDIPQASPNWAKIMTRKNAIVGGFQKGLTGLIGANQIKLIKGKAIVLSAGKIRVDSADGSSELECKNIILASGSRAVEIPSMPFDGKKIISSKEALELEAIPQSMVVVGGGVIGCEMACVYAAMGAKVTIVEALDRLLPMEDDWVGKMMSRELKKLGIESMTSQKVSGIDTSSDLAVVKLESGQTIEAEKVLISVGRKAWVDPETVSNLGLQMKGKEVAINERLETNVKGVYAIGDAVGTTYLAHGAFAEAEIVAEILAGKEVKIEDYSMIPRAVYTFPEVASVGKGEMKCAAEGIEVEVGRSFFKANGRSLAHNETIGEIRVIKDKNSKKVLGVTMVGSIVTELVCAARALIGTTEDVMEITFPHPTVSEVLKEAFEDAFGLSLHNPPKK